MGMYNRFLVSAGYIINPLLDNLREGPMTRSFPDQQRIWRPVIQETEAPNEGAHHFREAIRWWREAAMHDDTAAKAQLGREYFSEILTFQLLRRLRSCTTARSRKPIR